MLSAAEVRKVMHNNAHENALNVVEGLIKEAADKGSYGIKIMYDGTYNGIPGDLVLEYLMLIEIDLKQAGYTYRNYGDNAYVMWR